MTIHEPSMPPRSLPRLSGFPFSFFLFLAFEIAASRAALWSMAKEFGEAPGLTPITGITYDIVALGLLGAVRLLLELIPWRAVRAAASAILGLFAVVLPIANHLYVRFFRVALEPAAAGRAGALDEISGLVLGAVTWPMAVFMAVIPLGLLLWAVIRGTKTRMPRLIPVLVSAGACGLLMASGAIAGNQCWQRESLAGRFPHPMHENTFIRWLFGVPRKSSVRMKGEIALSINAARISPEVLRSLFPLDGDPDSRFLEDAGTSATVDFPLARKHGLARRRERLARFGIDADRLDEGPLNLVIVTMESVRASELKASGHRAPYLPTLDRLAAEGLYAERAFSTSLQSSEATFAVNCGYYPLSTGRPFFGFKPNLLHARCLPEILAEHGRATSHYIGCKSDFEGEGEFLLSHGMARITDEKSFPKDAERFTWKGRAVSDGELFARAGKDAVSLPQPFFLSVTTMTSHGPFDLPEEVAAGLDVGGDFHGDYLKYRRALAYLDRELGKFIEALSARPDFGRTLFLIYGDHGVMDPYPQGVDAERLGLATASAPPADIDPSEEARSKVPDRFSVRWNFAAGAHQRELAYRIPVILWSPGGLIPPGRIRGNAAQIDFLPTLLDLLGIEAEGTFLGVSMFDIPEDRKIILGMGGPHAVQGDTRCWTTERECIDVAPSFDADLYGTFRAAPADAEKSRALRKWAREAEEGSAILGRRNQIFPASTLVNPPQPAK